MRKLLTILVASAPVAAFAQATPAAADPTAASQYASFLPLVLIFGIFYILLIRPQQKRMKEHQALLSAIQVNDQVVTSGGILGKITKVDGDKVQVEIAKGVEVTVLKATVSSVVGKEPVKTVSDKKKNDNTALNRDSVANDN